MLTKVSASINVAELVDTLNVSPTRATNLKYKIYYFLSLLTDTNDNYRLNSENRGYHNLCSNELKKILGNKDFYIIRELLLNPKDPIIEMDKSWYNPNGRSNVGYCQGYKITQKYNTGEVIYKTIPNKMAKVILKNEGESNDIKNKPKYKYLINQFESNKITFDPLIYEYIFNFGIQLMSRVSNENQYQLNHIHNLIGRWLCYIEQIKDSGVWSKVSDKNHRLNSSITNLPRLLRPFLLCNGEPLTCVDISSSQPYILSSIIQSRFYYDTGAGYNLYSIYPELYKELVDLGNIGCIDSSTTYSSNNGIQYYSSTTSNTYSTTTTHSSSFMWCNFFSTTELESIRRYTQSPFNSDFYTYVLDRYYTYTNTPSNIQSIDRDKLKVTMMYVLFDDNQNHRNNNQQIQIFQTVFPGVDRWINQVHKIIGKQRFSYLLQRAESYLLLNVICREFSIQYPSAPLITIHDGVFTTEQYIQNLNCFVLSQLYELTGILAGCKIKVSQIDSYPHLKDVEKEWDKIKSIETEEKYNKNRNGVFTSNIKRGSNFLKNFGADFFNGIDDIT
jgi:hypothetical protein